MMDALTIPRRYGGPRLTVGGDELRAAEGDHLAIVITAAAVALLPLLRPQGPANIAPVDALIVLALSSSLLWAGMSGKPWRFVYTFPVALFVVGGALGALAGPVPTGGLIALLQDLWLLAWCICVANVCRTPRALAIVLRTWVWSSMVWAVLLLAGEFTGSTYLAGIQSNEGGRTSLTFGDPNYSAHYFFLSMMIIAATRYPRHRAARVLMYMILLPPWAMSGSNSGIIELLLGIAVIALVAVYRRSGLLPTVAAACSLLIFGALLLPRVPLARIQTAAHDSHYRLLRDWVGRSEKTVGQRKELVHESIRLFYTGGPFGEGPTSTIHRLTTTQAPLPRETHDDYLAALVERGFLGALGMILLVGSVFVRAGSIIRKPLSPAFAEVVPRAGPILAAVVGTFVLATVYEVLHARHVWALFGIVAALFLWGRE
jgi:O-antigen ligase